MNSRCPFCGDSFQDLETASLDLDALFPTGVAMEGYTCLCGAIWYEAMPDVEPEDDGL